MNKELTGEKTPVPAPVAARGKARGKARWKARVAKKRKSPKKPLPDPLTVLQLVPRLDAGGVERGTIEIAEAIVSAGGRALVATAGGALEPMARAAGAELVRLDAASKNPFTIWRNARHLRHLIAEARVDVIHARSRAPAWSGYLAARKTGTPFVTTWHGTYGEGMAFKRSYNGVMARGRPVIAVSRFIRDLIVERHGTDASDIVVIPRGADMHAFSEDAVGEERTFKAMRRLGIADDPRPVIMLPARLTRWKGAESLIDAAETLKSRIGAERFHILIVGADPGGGRFARELEQRILALGVTDCVSLTGGVEDMAAALKLTSVAVSASIEPEAFGRAIVEAQAMGRPVIAADHGGARETVIDGETGWLYPPGDAGALADALDRALAASASDRAHMGMKARAHVHGNYAIAEMQHATLKVYERVAGRPFDPAAR